ncbi:hypothetical protein Pcinc_035901 [Petrolisthes cinctipes]|uniref:Uncharacterized protein n=1 Tax=Petrolisthes cinctipes TaxID=88211 RepID=A0AAE1BYT1_PETCI|nr:hypothetical protein Pcinc_035901 [Petrolisthes cinctipes]
MSIFYVVASGRSRGSGGSALALVGVKGLRLRCQLGWRHQPPARPELLHTFTLHIYQTPRVEELGSGIKEATKGDVGNEVATLRGSDGGGGAVGNSPVCRRLA